MRKTSLVLVMAALLGSGAVLAQAKAKTKVVCWNDDKGHKMCGDRVPPEYAKQKREVMNERGIVVETKAREKTAEERAADALKVEEAKKAAEQAKYDKYLMQTYQNVSDLEAVRKERVTALEGRLGLAEKAVGETRNSVKTLHERVEALKKKQKEPDKGLAKQVKEYDKALLENLAAVEALKAERQKTITKFDTDIARFKELRPQAAATVTTP